MPTRPRSAVYTIYAACALAPALALAIAPAVATPPLEEPVLAVGTAGLSWTSCEGADSYDLLWGDLNVLRQSGGNFGASVLGCLGQVPDLGASHADTPAPGGAWWYLVRAVGSNAAGTYDASSDPTQAAPRDASIETSPYACFDPVAAHAPISILSDGDFTAANGVVRGSGTDADPYLIGGWLVGCATQAQTGVLIQNTLQEFLVRNLQVSYCGDAVRLQNVPGGRVERSRFDHDANGIVLEAGGGQRLEGNTASGLSGTGIEVHQAAGALVKGNSLYGNHAGIRLDDAVDASVHHNDLLGNALQATEQGGSGNAWDDGFPGGGNFWDDYAGVDHCGGAAQNQCSGGDGLGDTPYPIGSAADRYPHIALLRPLGDQVAPVVSIQTPAPNTPFASAQIPVTVSGTDTGFGIARVELRDNGGAWMTASGPQQTPDGETWSGILEALNGSNLIEARGRDFAGNYSTLASVTVTATPPAATWATSLTTDSSSYLKGETVTMHYRVRNITTSPVVVTFTTPTLTHFVVTDSHGAEVWAPIDGTVFYSSRSFAPAVTVDYVMSWDQKDNAGEFVVPGTYHLQADTDSLQDVTAADADITVGP
jgi:parallel beta-helix repeat protein